jgi:hypothetical protein
MHNNGGYVVIDDEICTSCQKSFTGACVLITLLRYGSETFKMTIHSCSSGKKGEDGEPSLQGKTS